MPTIASVALFILLVPFCMAVSSATDLNALNASISNLNESDLFRRLDLVIQKCSNLAFLLNVKDCGF